MPFSKEDRTEVGSGALREALAARRQDFWNILARWDDDENYGVDDAIRDVAALSLSSPIEPPPDYPGCTVNELALELKRTVMVLCETRKHTGARPCKFCTDMHLWRLYQGVNEPVVPVPSQASSEVREAAFKEAINLLPGNPNEHDSAQFREGYYSGLEAYRQAIRDALAPSRQGAGGK